MAEQFANPGQEELQKSLEADTMDAKGAEPHSEQYSEGPAVPPAQPFAEEVLKPGVEDREGNRVGGGVLHVAAVATHLERYMPLLVQSSARLGVKLEVLGWGEKLTGFAFRLQKTLEYVLALPPNDVVLFIDAFDVILLQNADVILKKFYSSGAQMICSKDGAHPNIIVDYFNRHVFRPVGNTYINIGAYIGYAGYVRDLMLALKKMGEGFSVRENDQELLARYLSQNKQLVGGEIVIDEHSDLFLTLYGGSKWHPGNNKYTLQDHANEVAITKDGLINYLPTNSFPAVVHFPANGNADELLEQLGYKLPSSVDSNYTSLNHSAYLFRMFKHYWRFMYDVLLKVVIAIVTIVLLGYALYCWRKRPAKSEEQSANGVKRPVGIAYVPYQAVQPMPVEIPRGAIFLTAPNS